jgi:hypothetical protein
MKLKLFVLGLLLLTVSPAKAQVAPNFVQVVTPVSCAAATLCAVNIPSTTAGDAILLGVFLSDVTATPQTPTDTQGNPFSLVIGPTPWGGSFGEILYIGQNIKGGADTINFSVSKAVGIELHPYEYHGAAPLITNGTQPPVFTTAIPSEAVDVVAPAALGTGTTATTSTLTTKHKNDLLFAYFHSNNNAVNTPGAGFTGRPATNPNAEDAVQAAIGTYTASMNFSLTASYVGFFIALRPPSLHTVTLTWTLPTTCSPPPVPPATCAAPTYSTIYRGTAAGGEGSTAYGALYVPTATYTDSDTAGSPTYFYEVTATNPAGESGRSAEVQAVIPQSTVIPSAPTNPKAVAQ